MVRHVREFDGLRGLMALWVLLGHWATAIYIPFHRIPANLGNVQAVDVFIILSGFAIATLLDRRKEPYPRYLMRRALRIFPVYWFYLALSVATAWLALDAWNGASGGAMQAARVDIAENAIGYFWPNILTHIPALQSAILTHAIPDGEFAFLGQAWSISLEWQFYIVAPFAIAALASASNHIGRALLLTALLGALAVASRYMPMGFIGGHSWKFALGIGTYYLLKWQAGSGPSFSTRQIASVAVLVIAMIVLMRIPAALPLSIWIACVAAVLAPQEKPLSLLSGFLTQPLVEAFGKMSYSVYLSHMLVMTMGMLVLKDIGIQAPVPHAIALLAITLCGTLPMSILSYRYIEMPFQQLGRKLVAEPKKPVARAAA